MFISHKKVIASDLFLVIIGATCIILSHGVIFPWVNQATYMLKGIQMHDPSLFTNDFFVNSEQTHYLYSFLVYFWYANGNPFISHLIFQILFTLCFVFGLLLISRKISPSHYPIIFSLIIIWQGLNRYQTAGLGGWFMHSNNVEPASIAGPLMLLGIGLLLHRRYLISGFILGIGGAFHASFMVSFAPLIFILLLLQRIYSSKKDLFYFGIPILIFWGWMFYYASRFDQGSIHRNYEILFNIRSPWHYLPFSWSAERTIFWSCISFSELVVTYKRNKILFYVCLVGIAEIAFWVFISIFEMQPRLRVIGLFRVAPFVFYISLLSLLSLALEQNNKKLIIVLLTSIFLLPSIGNWGSPFHDFLKVFFVLLVSLPLVFNYLKYDVLYANKLKITSFLLLTYAALLVLLHVKFYYDITTILKLNALAGSFMLLNLFIYWESINKKIILISYTILSLCFVYSVSKDNILIDLRIPDNKEKAEMEEWVRENTPKDSVFIISNSEIWFRVRTFRNVLIDHKKFAFKEGAEWLKRQIDVYNIDPQAYSTGKANDNYSNFSNAHFYNLSQNYEFDYILRRKIDQNLELPLVYKNNRYEIYKANF